MAADPISPIASARVRALLLPVGRISKQKFNESVVRLRAECIVRLGDISPDQRPDRNLFSPLAFPDGNIIYDFRLSVPSPSELASTAVELFREIFLVIGIADALEYTDHGGSANQQQPPRGPVDAEERLLELQETMGRIREQFPKALSLNLVLFDVSDPTAFQDLPLGTLTVPPLDLTKATTMKTVMCDISAMLLAEMALYAQHIANLRSSESLAVPTLGYSEYSSGSHREWSSSQDLGSSVTTPNADMSQGSTLPDGGPDQSRPATPVRPNLPSSRASRTTNGSRPSTPETGRSPPPSLNFGGIMSNNTSPEDNFSEKPSPQRSDSQREMSRDRKSVLGLNASGLGDRAKNKLKTRQGIIMGTLYLHAGRWPDALRELFDATMRARAYSDHLWHAKGLETILVTMIMHVWAGVHFQIPPICYPTAEKSLTSKLSLHASSHGYQDTASSESKASFQISMLKELSALIPDLLNMILNIQMRGYSSSGECLPLFTFSECAIRYAHLMSLINHDGGSLRMESIHHIVRGKSLGTRIELPATSRSRDLSKQDISSFLFRALPSSRPGSEMSSTDKLMVFGGMARVLSLLGLPRKRAIIAKSILSELVPNLVQARKLGAAEAGIHPTAGLSTLDAQNADGSPQSSSSCGDESISQMHVLLQLVCRTYGVLDDGFDYSFDKREHYSSLNASEDAEETDSRNLSALVESRQHQLLEEALLRSFGGIRLKTEILQVCMDICDILADATGSLELVASYLKTVGPGIAPKEKYVDWKVQLATEKQVRLASKISYLAETLTKNSQKQGCRYWDDFLVRGIYVAEPEQVLLLTSHKAEAAIAANSDDYIATEAPSGPFIYDPFTKPEAKTTSKSVLVAGDEATFVVSFQNLYEFEVVVEEISIISEGVKIFCQAQSFIIGPYRTQQHVVIGTAESDGELRLIGCLIKITGCQMREFFVFDTPWSPEGVPKVKNHGLAASMPMQKRPISTSSEASVEALPKIASAPNPSVVLATVIKSQPVLVVTGSSIAQSTFMILEGESRVFTITVQNVSESTQVDFLHISFQDSTMAVLEARSSSNMAPAELFEVEYQAVHRPALQWRRKTGTDIVAIDPGTSETFEIEVFGKAGLTDATVRIDYAHLGVIPGHIKEVFYTRHVFLPVTVTVNASIHLQKVEMLPMPSEILWTNQQHNYLQTTKSAGTSESPQPSSKRFQPESRFKSYLDDLDKGANGKDYFMLLLELRNAWPRPLALSINVLEDQDHRKTSPSQYRKASAAREVIQPGHAARLFVVLPRVLFHDPARPVPIITSARQKQFIVTDNHMSSAGERAEREAFWYRQDLLGKLQATWKDEAAGKEGIVEVRGLRLTPQMIEIMKKDLIEVEMDVAAFGEHENVNHVEQNGLSRFKVQVNSSVTLKIRLTNRSGRLIKPIIRLQPRLFDQSYSDALDLARRLIWTGLLQQNGTHLGPYGSTELCIDFCVLSSGMYEIGVVVEDIRSANETLLPLNKAYEKEHATDDDGSWSSIVGRVTCRVDASGEL